MEPQEIDPVRKAVLAAVADLPDAETRARIADEIVRDQRKEARALAGGKDLVLSDLLKEDRFYAIHNDDVEILKESVAVAAAICSGLPNPVAIVGGLVLLLYRIRKKSIPLTGPEALVLKLIAESGRNGSSRDGLRRSLSDMRSVACVRAGKNLDTIIKRLQNARRRDNTVSPLIEERDAKLYSLDV